MIFNRLHLENDEERLAPYALKSKNSRGRLYPDHEPGYRTAFQRDRDRVVHTTAFRRLEYKTQVFVNYEGDHYRTRLTHTLEVAQVGRTIARALGLNEDLTETICLSHDLGHPPFGHAGEAILHGLMAEFGGFDHNKQSFRIVTKLERRYSEFPGLNLCWETLEGMVKHETEYDLSEATDFEPETQASLEAQIANIADETAYNVHDIDDALRSGLISANDLGDLGIWKRLMSELGFNHKLSELERRIAMRELLGLVITDLVINSSKNLHDIKSVDDVRRNPHKLITHSIGLNRDLRELKDFLHENFYNHYRVVRQVHKAEYLLTSLFQAYRQRPKIMPPNAQARIEIVGLERTICDYLAGMTDRYAMDEHKRLYSPYERT